MVSEKKLKREISTLIPYKRNGDEIYVFLQRRDANAKLLPDFFGFFGGGIESGETPEMAMLRETKEELDYEPYEYRFFNQYEFLTSINNVFIIEVDDTFEDKIEVREGRYGKFLSKEEVDSEKMLSDPDKQVLKELFKELHA